MNELTSLGSGARVAAHVGALIARLAAHRAVRAGSIVGAACVAPPPEALKGGDRVRIETPGRDGASVFGAIDQAVRVDLPPVA